jgi:hypothetical protein
MTTLLRTLKGSSSSTAILRDVNATARPCLDWVSPFCSRDSAKTNPSF